MSDSLWPHESQHTRPPSCLSSQWCHPAISSSVVPFSSCPQSLPASVSFPMSQLFAWGGQSIGVSALVSFLPKNTQDWCPSEWTGWISLQSKGLLQHHSSKASILWCSAFFIVQLSHPYMNTGKTIALTRLTFGLQLQSSKDLNWRRQWQPTAVLLPGKSHGWRSLIGCSPWVCKESDTTERFHFHFSL